MLHVFWHPLCVVLIVFHSVYDFVLFCANPAIISWSPNWNWTLMPVYQARDFNTFPCEWPVNTSCSVKPLSLCVQITLRQNGFFTVHLIVGNPTILDTGL